MVTDLAEVVTEAVAVAAVVVVGIAEAEDIITIIVLALRKRRRIVLHQRRTGIRQTHSLMPRLPHLTLLAHLIHLAR